MKIITFTTILLLTFTHVTAQTNNISNVDSTNNSSNKDYETELDYLKKHLFISFYYEMVDKYYQENNIVSNTKELHFKNSDDSICFQKLIVLDYSSTITFSIGLSAMLGYMNKLEEETGMSSEKLFNKWLKKDYMYYYKMAIGDAIESDKEYNKKGNVLFIKALNFYGSDDLKEYIDAIRQLLIKEDLEAKN